MAPEVKFTSFGIPYLVEFANVTFRRKKRASRITTTLYSIPHCNDSDWTFASLYSDDGSEEEIKEPEPEGEGLYIRFASQAATAYPAPLSQSRLTRLKYRIAKAVVAAGMDPSAPNTDALDSQSCLVSQAQKALPPVPVSSFYSGTYGQVMDALESAGLIAATCDEAGFEGGE